MSAVSVFIFLVLLLMETKLTDATTQAVYRQPEISPIKCSNETGNELSEAQRGHIIHTINRFRAIINDGKRRRKRAEFANSNYRKVGYSCILEAELKFECNDDLSPEYFKSDEYVWRRVKETEINNTSEMNDFLQTPEQTMAPFNNSMQNAFNEKDTLRMALSPDVTEIGCFDKICNGFEYIACKTGYAIVASADTSLRTPNSRCKKDADCTLPGYTRCDAALGLCDLDPPDKKDVSPLVCLTLRSPRVSLFKEKCDRIIDTGSAISEAERLSIVNSVNEYRAMINNNCKLGLGIPKPASNYRKVKYSCAFESELKFECSSNLKPETFISDGNTWRNWGHKTKNNNLRLALFHLNVPLARLVLIDPDTATVGNGTRHATFMKLFMSDDVTEVGCYVKVCDEKEYIACKSNHDPTVSNSEPLYTPGQRCNVDADCTLPGYHNCDASVGLCDYKSHYARRIERDTFKCADRRNVYIEQIPETCKPGGYDIGNRISNLEREVYVYITNQFRARINNNCDFGKGSVKSISNYRKVKYSCALEERAKFNCPIGGPDKFKSDRFTLKVSGKVQTASIYKAIFVYWSSYNQYMRLDPKNQTVGIGASENIRSYVNFMMSPDVTEFGCFVRVCGDYEYMACKTGEVVLAPKEKRLYTPGKRCMADEDCTLPGYTRCDTALGLCDFDLPKNKKVVSPLVCLRLTGPRVSSVKEKCDGSISTGSAISVGERSAIADSVNEFRAMINNNCSFGLGVPKPASNYRKVKYSCDLEIQSKFECHSKPKNFTSENEIWRCWHHKKAGSTVRLALFDRCTAFPHELKINTSTSTVENHDRIATFMKLFMSDDVTEVGCYVKVCGEKEYIACKTNHDSTVPNGAPLYTPGQRCNVDSDCTLPGYHTCDASIGLCDFKTQLELKDEARTHKCDDVRSVYVYRNMEQCSPGYNTGSNMSHTERELIVYTVNYYRKLINNNCNFGNGIVKHITNYRKVKYSCAFEDDVKFKCADVNSNNFKSDKHTLRTFRSDPGFYRTAVFERLAPYSDFMLIDPYNQTIGSKEGRRMNYARIMLSPEVTEIGCFLKVCNGSEYLACKTSHPIAAPQNTPLYKPGNRCIANADCTLPGYRICDIESGLCESY